MADSPRGAPRPRAIERASHPVARVFRRSLASGVTPEGWVAIEGPILFREALLAGGSDSPVGPGAVGGAARGVKIRSVLVTEREKKRLEDALRTLPRETEVNLVSEWVFERVTQTEAPRGIAALVELPERNLDRDIGRRDALLLVACGLQDPGNLGSMVRSAQALGGSALLVLPDTVSPFNPKAVRSSAGAVFRLPIFTGLEPALLFRRLRSVGVRLLAGDRRSPMPLRDADLRGPAAILIGQEGAGLDEALSRRADVRVAIPIRRDTDSLNAATAAGIFLYEAARQRGFVFHEPV
ncbi:MAG TPA: RNA methyltransferase [Terriglobia bacterium]|nr:RNA methyltransferase [Terriglobia bacterium]